jgi:hypothetical protein
LWTPALAEWWPPGHSRKPNEPENRNKHQNRSEIPVKKFTISEGNQRKEFITIL